MFEKSLMNLAFLFQPNPHGKPLRLFIKNDRGEILQAGSGFDKDVFNQKQNVPLTATRKCPLHELTEFVC
jgi:hypothetical protein